MKDIVWTLQVVLTVKGGGSTPVRKVLKLSFPPSAGIEIDDVAWNEPREVRCVTFSTHDGSFLVALGLHPCDDKAELAQMVEMYESHGWKRLG